MPLLEILNRRFVDSGPPSLPPRRKREKAWGPDILRFLTTIWLKRTRSGGRNKRREDRGREARDTTTLEKGGRWNGAGGLEGWDRVKACTGTKDHGEFLEIGARGRGRQREKEKDRSNEADSLFSVFSASGGIGPLSGRAFSFFSPVLCPSSALRLSPSSAPVAPERFIGVPLSPFRVSLARHNEAFMS